VAALTALQGLRDKGRLRPGQQVLINGASDGVGTFAVQLAKALSAQVIGVCSTRNVDLVDSLGADHVIDYTSRTHPQRPALRSAAGCRRGQAVVGVPARPPTAGDPRPGRGAQGQPAARPARSHPPDPPGIAAGQQKVTFFISKANNQDLAFLQELLAAGTVTPVVERSYPLRQAADALRHLGEGHAQGKLVITV
jgi:NADPH:quinone reductase-like Zn-dependent oxidoreductase